MGRENDNCECFTSIDTMYMYMENKTWYQESCNCIMKYPTLIIVPQTKDLISNDIFLFYLTDL